MQTLPDDLPGFKVCWCRMDDCDDVDVSLSTKLFVVQDEVEINNDGC